MTEINQPQTPNTGSSGLAPNVASLLCYVCSFVTGIIFLIIEKNDKRVRFHAWQAIFFGVAIIVIQIGFSILTTIMAAISGVLGTIFGLLGTLISLGVLVVWVILMVKAYQGEQWKLPYLGDLAEAQNNKA